MDQADKTNIQKIIRETNRGFMLCTVVYYNSNKDVKRSIKTIKEIRRHH